MTDLIRITYINNLRVLIKHYGAEVRMSGVEDIPEFSTPKDVLPWIQERPCSFRVYTASIYLAEHYLNLRTNPDTNTLEIVDSMGNLL